MTRDPRLVIRDVENGLVSPESAERDYGVKIAGGKARRVKP